MYGQRITVYRKTCLEHLIHTQAVDLILNVPARSVSDTGSLDSGALSSLCRRVVVKGIKSSAICSKKEKKRSKLIKVVILAM